LAEPRRVPAGDFDYEPAGSGYARLRRPDPRVAALVHAGLGDARTVVNVGAGAGSYEPADRLVTAVEPSAAMRAQRPAGLSPAIDAVAEALPFADDSFDAAMATVTVHQWPDPAAGLRELRRVARGPVVILTFDADALERLWLFSYFPDLLAIERRRFPAIAAIRGALGGVSSVAPVPVPIDCVDGFAEAYYARPQAFFDPDVRGSQSGWGFMSPAATRAGLDRLQADLDSGEWDRRFGALRSRPEFVGAVRLIVSVPAATVPA
jgi:SAM-dependent methyltransferase